MPEIEEHTDRQQRDDNAGHVCRYLDKGQPIDIVVEEVLIDQHADAAQVAKRIGYADEETDVAAIAEQSYPPLEEHRVEAGVAQIKAKP